MPRARASVPLRIGVLTNMSGVLSDISGAGPVLAAGMAVEDFGDGLGGRPIAIVFADYQNKPETGTDVARRWIATDGVSAIADVPTSSVTLAVQQVCCETGCTALLSGAGSPNLTGPSCSPLGLHWTYDTCALAKCVGATLVRAGGTNWFFMTDDCAFCLALERDTTRFIFPMGSSDIFLPARRVGGQHRQCHDSGGVDAAMPVSDFMSKDVVIHDTYTCRVKRPAESLGPWDYYALVQTMAAGSVLQPLAKGNCPLVKG